MKLDDIKRTLIQAIAAEETIEVSTARTNGAISSEYAFGQPTAFSVNVSRNALVVSFLHGESAHFFLPSLESITAKDSREWAE